MSNVQTLHIAFNQEDDLGMLSIWRFPQRRPISMRSAPTQAIVGDLAKANFDVTQLRPSVTGNGFSLSRRIYRVRPGLSHRPH